MRIPGSRPVSGRLVRWFELTDGDVRVLRRGYRDVKATVTGSLAGVIVTGGNPFTDVKGAATTVAVSAATAMAGKYGRERQNGYPDTENTEEGDADA